MDADEGVFWEASLPAPRVPQDPAARPSEATQPPKEKKAGKLQVWVIFGWCLDYFLSFFWSFQFISNIRWGIRFIQDGGCRKEKRGRMLCLPLATQQNQDLTSKNKTNMRII